MTGERGDKQPRPLSGAGRQCPICGKPSLPRYRPFCSGRCADIDLGRWLKGNYAVPTEEPAEDDPSEG